MALSEEQVVALEGVLEAVEALMDRCERQLLKGSEAAQGHAEVWRQAMESTTADSDEWRYLDRLGKQTAWWEGTATGYVDPGDSRNFGVLREGLKKILEEKEPEFLRAQKRPKRQRFFNAGEEYQAKLAMFQAMKRAQVSLWVVDEYLDETVFSYLESLDPGIQIRLLTANRKPIFQTVFAPFAAQRRRAAARFCGDCHDRFLVLDETQAVHSGASINGIGKKAFMLNEVTDKAELARLVTAFKDWWAKGQPIT